MEGENSRLFAWLNGADAGPSQGDLMAQVSQLQQTVQALTEELADLRRERPPPAELADAETQTEAEEKRLAKAEEKRPAKKEEKKPAKKEAVGHSEGVTFGFGTGRLFSSATRSTGDALRDFLALDFAAESQALSGCLKTRKVMKQGSPLLGAEADHVPDYSSQFLERRWLKARIYGLGSTMVHWRVLGSGRVTVEDGNRLIFERRMNVVGEDTRVVQVSAKKGRPAATYLGSDGEKMHVRAIRFFTMEDRDAFMGWLQVKRV